MRESTRAQCPHRGCNRCGRAVFNQQSTMRKNSQDYSSSSNLKPSLKLHIIMWTASSHKTSSQSPPWNLHSHPILPFILCIPRVLLVNDIFHVLISLLKIRHNESFYISGSVSNSLNHLCSLHISPTFLYLRASWGAALRTELRNKTCSETRWE